MRRSQRLRRARRASFSPGPQTSRPHMPGYGVLGATEGKGLLPWSWAVRRLERSHNYWVATTRPDGRAHLMPVWGLWLEGKFYFSTGAKSRKARNLRANAYCVVSTERGDEAVIVEGTAQRLKERALFARVAKRYKAKYGWQLEPGGDPVFAVQPGAAFGFIEHADDFLGTATRWRFT